MNLVNRGVILSVTLNFNFGVSSHNCSVKAVEFVINGKIRIDTYQLNFIFKNETS